MEIEKVILKNLLTNQDYLHKVLPTLKDEYFINEEDRVLYNSVSSFVTTYNVAPTPDALLIEVRKAKISEGTLKNVEKAIKEVSENKNPPSLDWLIDNTEEFCKEKALYNAIMSSIDIIKNENGKLTRGAIPTLLADALAVTLDPHVGHDYTEEYKERWEYYHMIEHKVPFDLEFFNKITKGGVSKKTLNVILAGPGVGKSLAMCHFASACLNDGKKVLYITLELAEKEVAKRIDANLMQLSFDDIMALPEALYEKKAEFIKSKSKGKLIIKEYPTATAGANHFRSLLNELKLKKKFKPDIIFIDYLNICISSRLKRGTSNSYEYVKAIAEELRGLAVENNVPIITATQTTRSGYSNTDVGLEDTSESFGLPATADLMVALIRTEELDALNQIMVKQLKNRYNDPTIDKRFVVGVDRSKMYLYDVSSSAQNNIIDSGQAPQPAPTFNSPKKTNDKFKTLKV